MAFARIARRRWQHRTVTPARRAAPVLTRCGEEGVLAVNRPMTNGMPPREAVTGDTGKTVSHDADRPDDLVPEPDTSSTVVGDEFAAEPVGEPVIDAPDPPNRARRPLDVVRLVVTTLALAATLLLGAFTSNTVAGISADVDAATSPFPAAITALITAIATLMALFLPAGVVMYLLIHRQFRLIGEAVLAFGVALVAGAGLRLVLANTGALAGPLAGYRLGEYRPLEMLAAAVIAMATVARLGRRPRWRVIASVVFILVTIAMLLVGSTVVAVAVAILLGRLIGLCVRWVVGSPPTQPSPRDIIAALVRVNIGVSSLTAVPTESRGLTIFSVNDTGGRRYVVHVLDRDHAGSGALPSLWRTLRLQPEAGGLTFLSLRRALEHTALIGMAMTTAGARTEELVVAAPIGPDAAILVFAELPGSTFTDAPAEDLSDARLDAAWRQIHLLHRRAVAHRSLDSDHLVAVNSDGAGLRIARSGMVAADELALRVDLAQLLVTLALLVGPARAVASAVRVLGRDRIAAAVPVLQPIVLSRAHRTALRGDGALLDDLREEILAAAPSAPVEAVRVERFRLRTVVSAIALTVAAFVLLSQVAGLDLLAVVRQADWRWLALAFVLSATRYLGAALGLLGFVAERLPFVRTVQAQVATSFVSLVAPAGVGGAALNVRFLQRSGVPAAAAVASVALWQLGGLVVNVGGVIILNVLTGTTKTRLADVPDEAFVALAVALVIGAIVFAVPAVRRFIGKRLKPYIDQVRPRLGSVFTRPGRVLTGLTGVVVHTMATVLVMMTCIRAFGGDTSFLVVIVIVLAGTALGSAAPTPGGLGAVEAVLATGLTAAGGLDGATAVSSVLLFRMLTFWLPVLPGWIAFHVLQRRGEL